MKKIIALALALIMALSMGVVALAAPAPTAVTYEFDAIGTDGVVAPGSTIQFGAADFDRTTMKVVYDFNKGSNTGVSMIEDVKIDRWGRVVMTLKESYTMTDAKDLVGSVKVFDKKDTKMETALLDVILDAKVNNGVEYAFGTKKAVDAATLSVAPKANTVVICDEDYAGYVKFAYNTDELAGTVKMEAKEKAYIDIVEQDKDIVAAIEEVLGEDAYEDAVLEVYTFVGAPEFKNEVEFSLEAWDQDDHYALYEFDGKAFTKVEAKFDEDTTNLVWSDANPTTYVLSDVELVLAEEETKNPDTGANDVVGVAAALAVVSLVAAGAVSLKK